MMDEKRLKYLFFSLSAALLLVMLLASRNAGISCDEMLHYDHSLDVVRYYTSHGTDKAALNTPVTHLKYYGQSYDNLVTILTLLFRVEDVYKFRNLMSALAGWITVLVTALFAIWLRNYRTGIIVLLLFAVSPTFFGHALDNLKDVPFALGYIAGIFMILKFIYSQKKKFSNIILLVLSLAFCISIRAGGLILVCYFFAFVFAEYILKGREEGNLNARHLSGLFFQMIAVSVISILLGIVLWPFALQNPVKNIIASYHVMAHFPDTFRQLFEGKMEWSDHMPWYYLLKSIGITVPFVIFAGLILYVFLFRRLAGRKNITIQLFIIFTLVFPVLFAIIGKSNVYSSWRQFLFIYPALVVLSAEGISMLLETLKRTYLKLPVIVLLALFCYNPVRFMIKNHPYEYIYYNELAGGLKGAYGNYETDYYFVSQTEASKWLIDYLRKNEPGKKVVVRATFSVNWLFRHYPLAETSFLRYEERSMSDWDYAIVVNRYIPPFKLKNGMWPPRNCIHVIYADDVPICAVLKRETKDDFYGYEALNEGRYADAVKLLSRVSGDNNKDEMIFYNFAAALYRDGKFHEADSVLKRGLEYNPDCEPILMYLGNIAKHEGRLADAEAYFERVINANMKYFEAYTSLAEILFKQDVVKARSVLRKCLSINPGYKPAVIALGDTYKDSDPEISKKLYDIAKKMN